MAAQKDFDPVELLVIQATPFCNIDCSYCYLSHRDDKRRMTLDTVTAIANFLREVPVSGPTLNICWHAGEPLVAPIPFYERAFQCFVDTSGVPAVQHSFQTNATLINDEWCELFKRWSVRIGVSVDGPQFVHDSQRTDRAGRGTFPRVMRGISTLRRHNVPFTVISVITRNSLDHADAIWQFYRSIGISYVGFNIDEMEGGHAECSLEPSTHMPAFRKFMTRIAELEANCPDIEVREFDSMRHHLFAPPAAEAAMDDNRLGAILNIDIEGNLTTFSPELLGRVHPKYGKFGWGNVKSDNWESFTNNASLRRAHAAIQAGVGLCRDECEYFKVCGGGCPSNKIAEHDTFVAAETTSCRFNIQAVADVVMEQLEKQIAQRNRQA